MAGMPGYHVSKGPFFYLEKIFDGTTTKNYTDARDALEAAGTGFDASGALNEAALKRFGPDQGWQPGTGPNEKLRDHFDNDWLNGSPNWKKLMPAETLRAGMLEAIKAALAPTETKSTGKPMPMEFFWVCAQENAFYIYYSISEYLAPDNPDIRRRVTVIVFTPIPERGPQNKAGKPTGDKDQVAESDLAEPEPIWVVKLKEPYEDNYTSKPFTGAPGSSYGPYDVVDEDSSKPPEWQIVKRQMRYEQHLGF